MFKKFNINFSTNKFDELSNSIDFENITDGRKGAILVDYKNNLVPLVRTTTVYNKPVQKFLPIHYDIIENIKKVSERSELEFNNALIELYDVNYRNMKYHSDQTIDLENDSYICLFSCYDIPSAKYNRKLKVKDKITNECSEIILENGSFVLFSLPTNAKYLHKIVLESNTASNQWLGITYRLSKTFIKFAEIPYIYPTNVILRLANKDERKEFFRAAGLESLNVEYKYPVIDYSISISDLLPIT